MSEPAREAPTTADYANARWFRKLTKGKRYLPSVMDALHGASTLAEVDAILATPLAALASADTRRKWARAADARRAALRVKALHG